MHEDVDGDQHVGVVLEDDPAADLHEWYGRYLYFAPDEVEPLSERSPNMEVVGWVAVGVVAAVVIGGAAVGVRSIPDARRYLKIRRM